MSSVPKGVWKKALLDFSQKNDVAIKWDAALLKKLDQQTGLQGVDKLVAMLSGVENSDRIPPGGRYRPKLQKILLESLRFPRSGANFNKHIISRSGAVDFAACGLYGFADLLDGKYHSIVYYPSDEKVEIPDDYHVTETNFSIVNNHSRHGAMMKGTRRSEALWTFFEDLPGWTMEEMKEARETRLASIAEKFEAPAEPNSSTKPTEPKESDAEECPEEPVKRISKKRPQSSAIDDDYKESAPSKFHRPLQPPPGGLPNLNIGEPELGQDRCAAADEGSAEGETPKKNPTRLTLKTSSDTSEPAN